MIFVQRQPEPTGFDEAVRVPGNAFLQNNPKPQSSKAWRAYWQNALEDLHKAYQGVCAYCAEWMPINQGACTVDHYIPKSHAPHLAYEWDNYRLASLRYNRLKRDYQDVLDPFTLGKEWFYIQFPSLQVYPNPSLPEQNKAKVNATIQRLRLNDENSIESRRRWIIDLSRKDIPFEYLQRKAPFIAYELERQGLTQKIQHMMG